MRFSIGFIGVSVMALLAAVGCGETASTDKFAPLDYESNPHSAKYDFSEVDIAAGDFLDAYGVAGLTLAVVREGEGQIYERGYGDFARDRISMIASTTKVLSAGVVLTLVDDGLVELDRPVAEYLGWGDYHPDVTIEHLLSNMSGMKGWDDPVHPCVADPTTTLQECGRLLFEDESTSISPGVEFRYSGDGWQLAGAVAEVVSGRSWEELLHEKLIVPCGLSNTGYLNDGDSVAYPEEFGGDPAKISPSENPVIGGGAYTTVNDYSKVLLMHLSDGWCSGDRVLSATMVQRMQEDLVPPGLPLPSFRPEAVNYGMGWWRFEEPPQTLVDSGSWGARAVLHPGEGWGAILIIEDTTLLGAIMYREIVPLIRDAIRSLD